MERIQVQGRARAVSSKGSLKRLRREGFIPGVIYGRDKDALPVLVSGKDLANVLALPSAMNTLVDLTVDGELDTVMIKDLTREILFRERFSHVDFLRVSMKEKISVQVPVHLSGEAAGARKGGVVQQALREVVLKCLPTEIPEQVELDISSLAAGQSLTVADLVVGEFLEVISDPAEVVVTVLPPRVEAEEAAAETGEES